MTDYLELAARTDRAAHDVAQNHLAEYTADARGPYPGHPHGDQA